jgi:hypothetical protein
LPQGRFFLATAATHRKVETAAVKDGTILKMVFFIILIAVYLLLQIWILPKLGVST